ncbi:MAG: hypothetical protein OXC98_11505 [bacterium]|nr:hypothetical protein [Acidimicrobiia bacterium]MCY4650977.1 hypothetical protein [bacterium]
MSRPLKWGELELPIRADTIIPVSDSLSVRGPLRACDLPGIMGEDDWFDAYRYALTEFVGYWNHSEDPGSLIADPPSYEGDDWRLLPTIASFVHALADRKGFPVPNWVREHVAPQDWVVFCDPPESYLWKHSLEKAPRACADHRVYFHPRLLDRGTQNWWLPWN